MDTFSATTHLSDVWKNYLATVAASLCDYDAEASYEFLTSIDYRSESPIDVIKHISELSYFSRRGGDENSNHVFAYARRGNNDELTRRLWSAQITVLFPIIEFERIGLINRLNEEIKTTLEQNEIIQYHRVLSDPMDVELGTLDYMMTNRGNNGLYFLFVPQEEIRNTVSFLHKCRNTLATAMFAVPNKFLNYLI